MSETSRNIKKVRISNEHVANHIVSFRDRLDILYLYKAHHMTTSNISKIVGKK